MSDHADPENVTSGDRSISTEVEETPNAPSQPIIMPKPFTGDDSDGPFSNWLLQHFEMCAEFKRLASGRSPQVPYSTFPWPCSGRVQRSGES